MVRWRTIGVSPWVPAALAIVLQAGPAAAVVNGQADTFASGLAGWGSGPGHPEPPAVVSGGGPGGADDAWLQVTSTGGFGAGSRLVAFAGAQWTGDYLAAGVTGIALWLRNAGTTDLSLRLRLSGPAGAAISLTPVLLPAQVGWHAAAFPLRPADLSGAAALVLADVAEVRLFHGTVAAFPGDSIAASIGIDQVSAVPEPGAAALLLAGLGVLAGAALWRAQRAGSPPRHRLRRPSNPVATRLPGLPAQAHSGQPVPAAAAASVRAGTSARPVHTTEE